MYECPLPDTHMHISIHALPGERAPDLEEAVALALCAQKGSGPEQHQQWPPASQVHEKCKMNNTPHVSASYKLQIARCICKMPKPLQAPKGPVHWNGLSGDFFYWCLGHTGIVFLARSRAVIESKGVWIKLGPPNALHMASRWINADPKISAPRWSK